MEITYGSVCSGIEAASLAWKPLGMRATWFAEIEAFPSAVLAHHYPNTPNLGDMTKLGAQVLAGKIAAPDILVGGTPCQAFSVAGMREGLADPRGALTIKYVELADATDYVRASRRQPPCVIVWENVPGVLSDKGNAFGCFLGALAGEDCELQPSGKRWPDAGCVYGPKRTIAWRVLDAQYFGLAQRRRRVFVIASARDGFDPTEVLFEREGMRRDTAPRRGEGQDVTGTAPFGPALQCGCGHVFGEELGPYGCVNCEGDEGPAVSMFGGIPAFGGHSLEGSVERSATLTAKDSRLDVESETFFVAPTLAGGARKSGGYSYDDVPCVTATLDASYGRLQGCSGQDANHGHSHLVVHGTQDPDINIDLAHPLGRNSGQENALMAFTQNSRSEVRHIAGDGQIVGALAAEAGAQQQNYLAYSTKLHHTSACGAGKLYEEYTASLDACSPPPALLIPSQVRRLIPRECERLQGMPDDYTLIPWRGKPAAECPDGPRYKAIGNSKAVTVVSWIGRRILRQIGLDQ
ncbi:DNA cytosine methyltransferase [Pseudomonas sp. ACN5]|uniref:DNA cytosine methyltransferase n=1 Tax=Pseudomonas sp. ACN5 TaxID=1920427 RepID=UPI000BB2FB90|nr:DNA cytosine methyltransferase [Pseudomonas sp. ACN5]PBJ02050.1 putative BsuMI modification methylase subunit YdiP [Pseudomonas sp. ACN5]